jgi:cytochrome c biogenesis protein CcdA
MKISVLFLGAAMSFSLFAADRGQSKLVLTFFGSPSCEECLEIKETLLKPLEGQHPQDLKINFRNIEDGKDFMLLTHMEKDYTVSSSSPQELFFPDTVIIGYDAIMKNGRRLIEEYLAKPEKWVYRHAYGDSTIDTTATMKTIRERIGKFSILSIVAAGIVDGINPCAIATMIFLVSFLATRKRPRREIVIIGVCYTSSVFLTYLLLGIGAFTAITSLEQYRGISQAIRLVAVALAFIFGVLSFFDAFRYRKSGNARDITLQLPKAVKLSIHRVISGNLSGTRFVIGSIVTGFLVTLLEAVCTGQVYLPTIILMTSQPGLRIMGWLYLIFYNILFVLPLIIVTILAYFGLRWERLSKLMQRRMTLLKILLGVLFISLALLLALQVF